MTPLLAFVAGAFVGVTIGFFVAALMAAAKLNDGER